MTAGSIKRGPHVTVVVLAYNNEDETAACLESLLGSTYEPVTILLVDNASPDGSGERLHARFPEVAYLQTGTNGGYTAGNNRGMEWALARGTDYVLLLNYDTEVDRHCIERLVRAAEETGAAATAPLICYYDEPNVVWYGGGRFSRTRAMVTHLLENRPIDPSQARMPITFVCGCCALIRAPALRELGGFDESYFMYGEDMELSVRMAAAGHRMIYEPGALVLHRIDRQSEPTPWQIVLRDKNRRRMVARHYDMLDRVRFAAWFYPTRAVHYVRYFVRGDADRRRAIVTGAFDSIADTRGPVRLA
jgi:GT2 family glycosyltransferase